MNHKRLTPAFSMLELVFVITILGIVSSIGAEMIAKVYEGYIVQRAEHRATIKTELAATQIANRLASAIPGTVYRKNTSATVIEEITDTMSLAGDQYTVLQWVASDMDSYNATAIPGWSGFCDINDPANTANSLSTPGSALATTTAVINNLSSSAPAPKIYFPYDSNEYNASIAGTTITLSGTGAPHIVEHYKLAWSSYALVVQNNATGGKDLYLYYDFSAIPAVGFANAPNSLLMSNISTFKFKGDGQTLRFKIVKKNV
ncbi:prepilin-type N-terminal cleavage/methylation domain-containing protein [Campylobacterota bacterium]